MVFFSPKKKAFARNSQTKVFRLLVLTLCLVVAFINAPSAADVSKRLSRMLMSSSNLSEDELEMIKQDIGTISRDNKLVYVHIPKTGGSTVEDSEMFDTDRLYEDENLRGPIGGHYTIYEMMQNSEVRGISDFDTATTIRHPCERFVSAFRYVTGDKCNEGDQRLAAAHIGNRTLDEFVELMEEEGWQRRMVHLDKMYTFLVDDDGNFGVDEVLCMEQWKEGVQRLFRTHLRKEGQDEERGLLAVLRTHLRRKGQEEEINLLVMKHLEGGHRLSNQHETCADLKPETRAALERHYAMDYCLFEYQSLPENNGEGVCIGIGKNKAWFTAKFQECKTKLEALGVDWQRGV